MLGPGDFHAADQSYSIGRPTDGWAGNRVGSAIGHQKSINLLSSPQHEMMMIETGSGMVLVGRKSHFFWCCLLSSLSLVRGESYVARQKSCGANHRLCPRTHTHTHSLSLADMKYRTMPLPTLILFWAEGDGKKIRPRPEIKTEKGEKRFAILGGSSPILYIPQFTLYILFSTLPPGA